MKQYYRDTWAEIDLYSIASNVKRIKANFQQEMNVMAIVKANGYGHGAYEVAKTALEAGAAYIGVATLDEAIQLRRDGITAPILVLGICRPDDVMIAVENTITVTVVQKSWIEQAAKHLKDTSSLKIHVKFDTGMGRIGITNKKEGKDVIELIKTHKQFVLEGVFTHFATADELDLTYFHKQYQRFLEVLTWLLEWEVDVKYIHCGNSATGIRFPKKSFNMFRLGISMYGLSPSTEIKESLPVKLEEAFSLHSQIIQVKHVPPNEGISYGKTYVTKDWEWIGTIPIGYADGWYRYHSTAGGHVLVNGKRAPFVGRICMDQCMVRLPEKVDIGTKVTLIGTQGNETISIDEVANRLGTINYEVPCMISYRVPRIFRQGEKIISVKNRVFY